MKNFKKSFLFVLLFFKNFFQNKTLKVDSIFCSELFVINNNVIELIWKVEGCHKIKINGIGSFPGNIFGLKFIFKSYHNPIEITFYGNANSIIREIQIESSNINFLEKFIANTTIPLAIEVPINKQKIESELSKDILKMELKNISFEFEPFIVEKYHF